MAVANCSAKARDSERYRPLTSVNTGRNATRPKWQPCPTRRRDSHPHDFRRRVVRLSAVMLQSRKLLHRFSTTPQHCADGYAHTMHRSMNKTVCRARQQPLTSTRHEVMPAFEDRQRVLRWESRRLWERVDCEGEGRRCVLGGGVPRFDGGHSGGRAESSGCRWRDLASGRQLRMRVRASSRRRREI
jgi:hypothetical protein